MITSTKETSNVDLDGNKVNVTKKIEYLYNDEVEKEWKVEGYMRIRIITNEKGRYIDIRKYCRDFPTKRGIRLHEKLFIIYFKLINDYLKLKS